MHIRPRHYPASLRLVLFVWLIALLVSLAACQAEQPAVAPIRLTTQPPTKQVTATHTSTTTQLPSATSSSTPQPRHSSPTPSPSPSPTASLTPDPSMVYYPAGRVSVPILLYHNISDKGSNRYITTIKTFRAEMDALEKNGVHTITIAQLADVIRNGGYLPRNPVVLTFDDGYLGVYENALPILNEYGFVGVMYVITSTLDSNTSYGYVQKKELLELVKAGWEIGSHSVTHSDLKLSKLGMRNEMVQSRETLETLLGIKVRTFAYPYAAANAWTRERAEEYGYDAAVGIDVLMTHSPKSLYYLSRREVPRAITQENFLTLLRPGEYEIAAFPLASETVTAVPTR